MNKFFCLGFIVILKMSFSQGVSINTTGSYSHDAAILDISSTNKGFLIPRLTTSERDNDVDVSSNPEGLLIFNTDIKCFEFYANGSWHGMGCFECGTSSVTFTYNGTTVTYGTVEKDYGGGNVKCWMDRNLGASAVATSSTHAASYGDLFQWGRGTDGHQVRSPFSGTTTTRCTSDNCSNLLGNSNRFVVHTSSPYDWRDPQDVDLWQGVSGRNNPCPSGWRIPTETEWNNERLSWVTNNAAGAYGSTLKLPMAGGRTYSAGSLSSVGTVGYYWSSTVSTTNSLRLSFDSSSAMGVGFRGHGHSVRCIKN